jgi:hypothetical protein
MLSLAVCYLKTFFFKKITINHFLRFAISEVFTVDMVSNILYL